MVRFVVADAKPPDLPFGFYGEAYDRAVLEAWRRNHVLIPSIQAFSPDADFMSSLGEQVLALWNTGNLIHPPVLGVGAKRFSGTSPHGELIVRFSMF